MQDSLGAGREREQVEPGKPCAFLLLLWEPFKVIANRHLTDKDAWLVPGFCSLCIGYGMGLPYCIIFPACTLLAVPLKAYQTPGVESGGHASSGVVLRSASDCPLSSAWPADGQALSLSNLSSLQYAPRGTAASTATGTAPLQSNRHVTVVAESGHRPHEVRTSSWLVGRWEEGANV